MGNLRTSPRSGSPISSALQCRAEINAPGLSLSKIIIHFDFECEMRILDCYEIVSPRSTI